MAWLNWFEFSGLGGLSEQRQAVQGAIAKLLSSSSASWARDAANAAQAGVEALDAALVSSDEPAVAARMAQANQQIQTVATFASNMSQSGGFTGGREAGALVDQLKTYRMNVAAEVKRTLPIVADIRANLQRGRRVLEEALQRARDCRHEDALRSLQAAERVAESIYGVHGDGFMTSAHPVVREVRQFSVKIRDARPVINEEGLRCHRQGVSPKPKPAAPSAPTPQPGPSITEPGQEVQTRRFIKPRNPLLSGSARILEGYAIWGPYERGETSTKTGQSAEGTFLIVRPGGAGFWTGWVGKHATEVRDPATGEIVFFQGSPPAPAVQDPSNPGVIVLSMPASDDRSGLLLGVGVVGMLLAGGALLWALRKA